MVHLKLLIRGETDSERACRLIDQKDARYGKQPNGHRILPQSSSTAMISSIALLSIHTHNYILCMI